MDKKIMKIWRVENEEGYGCYISHLSLGFIDKHNLLNGHPRPEEDKGINRIMEHNEICGFIDKKQARNWFNYYELKCMESYGFYLKEIKVNKLTGIGEKQVLAIR